MIRFLLMLVAVFMPFLSIGQEKLSNSQKQQILGKIDNSASLMTSMQCEFTQTKVMKMLNRDMESKGIMFFKRPDKLRWQYNTPYKYVFILNERKVHIESSASSQNIDVKHNKIFKQMSDIILGCITGNGLKNSFDFIVDLYKDGDTYYARLIPKKKEIKQVYDYMDIWFDPSLSMVSSIRMVEKTGDVTVVKLYKVKINDPIDSKCFLAD